MRGISGRPFIDLTAHIDKTEMTAIDTELKQALPLAQKDDTVYGGLLSQRERGTYFIEKNISSIKFKHPDFYEVYQSFECKWQKRRFARLYFQVPNSNQSVYLIRPDSFQNKHLSACCQETKNKVLFPKLINFVSKLPFEDIGRVLIFINYPNSATPIHRDSEVEKQHREEFIWFRTNLKKRLFIFDVSKEEKHYVDANAAFFNSNDYHGSEAGNVVHYSVRVDGIFSSQLRQKLGLDERY